MSSSKSAVRMAGCIALRLLAISCAVAVIDCPAALAQSEQREAPASVSDAQPEAKKPSPWIFAPVLNSSPKLGAAGGATVAYLKKFDAESRPSIFAVTAQYSTTDSLVGALLARTSFDKDRQRLNAALSYGNIKNDYDDYLGTGVPLRNDAALKSFIGRYLHRVHGDWFLGAQGVYQNFDIAGITPFDELVLDVLGVAPYKSGGLGLVGYFDSRENEFKPMQGWVLSLNNLAYRESLGGENDFDVYRFDVRHYAPFGNGSVFAFRLLNHLTSDAPTQNQSPVQLRGYKVGQYTGTYMSQLEGEARLRVAERWTATVFAGVACTYGDGKNCSAGDNLFPAAGAGVQYVLKPAVGIVLNLEYAQGKAGNYGVYLKTGYAF